MPNPAELQPRLGYQFRDESLLRLALTHPSVAHETNTQTAHNQRLEFLGDSVLGIVLSSRLYEKFPEADEGALTKSRAKLGQRCFLCRAWTCAWALGAYLIISRGEENTGGRERASALADAFEAVLGAVFFDGVFLRWRRDFCILREFAGDFEGLALQTAIANPWRELQEWLQVKSPVAPVYRLISAEGPDHERRFVCAVLHEEVELARGSGKSKKDRRKRSRSRRH